MLSSDHPFALRPNFWQLPLADLTQDEWEALCDGCGVCCLVKYLDEDDPRYTEYTDVACKLLNTKTGHCSDYEHRKQFVPDCIGLTVEMMAEVMWLPKHCAYKRLHLGQGLPHWHYLLVEQDKHDKAMDKVGVRGRCVSEVHYRDEEIEERVVKWVKI